MSLIPGLQIDEWRASFAWTEEFGGPGLTVRRFRRGFRLDQVPNRFTAYVTADSRYLLWVNGRPVGRGPLKGSLENYHYEAYDLVPYLQQGDNAIAAEVRWFGRDCPQSEVHSERAGFLFQGPEEFDVDTPGQWRIWIDRAITPDTTVYYSNATQFLNHMEKVDARQLSRGWTEVDFDDGDWLPAVDTGPAGQPNPWGVRQKQNLVPRPLPLLVEKPQRFAHTICDRRQVEHLFADPPAGWTVPAGKSGEIVLDAGGLTTAYPIFTFSGGKDREVAITYAECVLFHEGEGEPTPWTWTKKVRDDIANGEVHGYRDTVLLSGERFAYEPFHWRTFWFVKVQVGPGEEPLCIEDASFRFTTFPQELKARFECSDPRAAGLFAKAWRTLQLCSHETYEDCPYYEQLQYLGDARLEAIASMAMAGETRLARRAIADYRDSLQADGMVGSRVPTSAPQIIPYFGLLWVLMVEDYWQWVGLRDRDFVRSALFAVDGVLSYFRQRLRPGAGKDRRVRIFCRLPAGTLVCNGGGAPHHSGRVLARAQRLPRLEQLGGCRLSNLRARGQTGPARICRDPDQAAARLLPIRPGIDTNARGRSEGRMASAAGQ